MNPTVDLLCTHRSIRRFTDEPIPDEHVRTAVAAGQMASTSSAVQAYCCIRVRDPESRAQLAELAGPQEKVARAPAFFLVCGDTRRHRLICDRAGQTYDQKLEAFLVSVIDASLFAQNMVVAFESMGYGICYIGGIRNNLPAVKRILEIPEGVYPLFGLCVGKPAETPVRRPRLPIDAVLFEERYCDDDAVTSIDAYDAQYRDYLASRGAEPRSWSESIAHRMTHASRLNLGDFYRSQGAVLD